MKNSIMTEKIERRGVRAPGEYEADHLDQLTLRDVARRAVVTLEAAMTVAGARAWLEAHPALRHQGYPVVDAHGAVVGVLTRKELTEASEPEAPLRGLLRRPAVVISDDASMRDAADVMAREGLGRLPVVSAGDHALIGIVTRSDLVQAHVGRLDASRPRAR